MTEMACILLPPTADRMLSLQPNQEIYSQSCCCTAAQKVTTVIIFLLHMRYKFNPLIKTYFGAKSPYSLSCFYQNSLQILFMLFLSPIDHLKVMPVSSVQIGLWGVFREAGLRKSLAYFDKSGLIKCDFHSINVAYMNPH